MNDALFSSADGGKTWDKGTVQCHDGDRPWLAGGRSGQVFMATDTVDGTAQRTAILSTPNDVVFVKSGDRVGTFTVTQVDENGVEVTGADGSIRRLVLTP